MKQRTRFIARLGSGLAVLLVTSVSWAQDPKPAVPEKAVPGSETTQAVPTDESPVRQPLVRTDQNGKSLPAKPEKLVLADPDSKLYMPCRDPNEAKTIDDSSRNKTKLNPKAAVLSEEAAKQHGFKPSPHEVDCPTK